MAEENTSSKESKRPGIHWAKTGVLFSLLAILILLAAFAYGYMQLANVNMFLADKVTELQNDMTDQQNKQNTLAQSIVNLQSSLQKSQELSSQQEKLMNEWQAAAAGDLKKWQVAEAQYLVKLANDHLQFDDNPNMALTLLRRADSTLEKINHAQVLEIRKSLATALTALEANPPIDVTSVYVKLVGLSGSLNQLPLPLLPLQAEETEKTNETNTTSSASWWRTGLASSWQALRKIVVVRYDGTNTLPLVLPEEKIFLYQNLQAQLEAAIWGLLHHNAEVYQTSLQRMQDWIKKYFDQKAQLTQRMLENLAALEKINIKTSTIDLDATLQLFEQYFSQNGTS